MAYLRYKTGGSPVELQLGDAPISIGRKRAADVSLRGDVRISHIHCYIEPRKGGYCVRDNASKNGTTLNGKKIHGTEVLLADGDDIMVGKTHISFYDQESSADGVFSKILRIFKKR